MIGSRVRVPLGRCMIAVGVLAATFLVVPPASADCPLLDPICVVEETAGTVEGTVEEVEETAGQVLDEVEETAGAVLEDPPGTVDQTLESVQDTVDQVLSGAGDVAEDLPAVDPPAGTPAPADPPPGSTQPGDPTGEGSTPGVPGDGTPVPTDTGFAGSTTGGLTGLPAGQPDASSPIGREGPSDPIGRLLGSVPPIAAVGFPLLLIAIVLLFLAVQDRIDRRDPKLALVPVGTEFVEFA